MPFFVYFLIYWTYYDLLWSVLSSVAIFFLVYENNGTNTFFDVLFSSDNISWIGFLPMTFLLAYYTIGTMVESVVINKEEKTMRVIHRPLFFWKKEITFSLEDDKFKFIHSSENKNLKSILLRWSVELFWESLHFYNKGLKNIVLIHDVCGWKKEQIEEICAELNNMSCSTT